MKRKKAGNRCVPNCTQGDHDEQILETDSNQKLRHFMKLLAEYGCHHQIYKISALMTPKQMCVCEVC